MLFEWDEAKNRANVAKHGIDFAYASRIFVGPIVSTVDNRFDYGEVRTVSVGIVDDAVIVTVVHTPRDGATRIISARKANPREKRLYEIEAL